MSPSRHDKGHVDWRADGVYPVDARGVAYSYFLLDERCCKRLFPSNKQPNRHGVVHSYFTANEMGCGRMFLAVLV